MLWGWFLNLDVVYWFREKQSSPKDIFVEIQKLIIITISHRNSWSQRLWPCEVGRKMSLIREYISHHEFIPLIHSNSGSLSSRNITLPTKVRLVKSSPLLLLYFHFYNILLLSKKKKERERVFMKAKVGLGASYHGVAKSRVWLSN